MELAWATACVQMDMFQSSLRDSNTQQNLRIIDLLKSSHSTVMEMSRDVDDLSKVTCIIDFRASVLSAPVGLARLIDGSMSVLSNHNTHSMQYEIIYQHNTFEHKYPSSFF